ncbi:MAG: hypothetical protein L6V88_05805 [Anaerotruncus sp.]|nr:MAG: hypothetical protein L6V88_05805 [Anaerotruncus sp.]
MRFSSENDERIKKATVIASIFEGDMPLYYYYLDKKHYELQPRSMFVQPNKNYVRRAWAPARSRKMWL